MDFNLEYESSQLLSLVKSASWFPYKTGRLKFHATSGMMMDSRTYRIHFDSTIAPYVEYLEEGTGPHNIPKGRFDGKFHPGSTKHQYFIKEKSVNAIVSYIETKFKGVVS